MMRFLIISILCSIGLLSGCSLKTTRGLREIPVSVKEIENPYFANREIDYVYKAKIEVYGRDLGGILIVKKMGPEAHRVVFTTEFGSKLFDFQFEGDTFIKNFIIEDLDRQFIVKVLRDDFKLLITEQAKVLELFEAETQYIFKTPSPSGFNFYSIGKQSKQLEKIINTCKRKEKVEINFYTSPDSSPDIAEGITIKHNNIKLKIELQKFKEN